ncbi:MAG TPA: hypothetical protein VKI65_01130 [Gemmataceae bacterium]|nr:hypothetical protein [Gemmataceae bacterium]
MTEPDYFYRRYREGETEDDDYNVIVLSLGVFIEYRAGHVIETNIVPMAKFPGAMELTEEQIDQMKRLLSRAESTPKKRWTRSISSSCENVAATNRIADVS